MLHEHMFHNNMYLVYLYNNTDFEVFPFDRQWPASFWVTTLRMLLRDTPDALYLFMRKELALKVFKRLKPQPLRYEGLWQGIMFSLMDESLPTFEARLALKRQEVREFYRDLFIGTRRERALKCCLMLDVLYEKWLETGADPGELM
jgi:hypothetical protein